MTGRPRWSALSLRYRLTLLAAAAVAVAVVVVSLLAFVIVQQQLSSQFDQNLEQDARTVAAAPRQWDPRVGGPELTDPDHDGDDDTNGRHDRDHDHEVAPRVQLLDGTGMPALAAGQAPILPITDSARDVVAGRTVRVYEDVMVGGREFRMLTLHRGGPEGTSKGAVQVAMSLDGVHDTLSGFGLVMLLVGLLGVAGAAALGAAVARAGLRPVAKLTTAVEHVATTTDLAERITVAGRDEIARLARAFNAMLSALAASRAAQRLLVEDAGHELRTPLTSLRANIELLIRADSEGDDGQRLPPGDRARLLTDLEEQMAELTQLVGELVDLAREGASPEPVEQVDLAELVDLATQRVRDGGARVEVTVEPMLVFGRPSSLNRMVANLLDNAVKWSPLGAAVRVRLQPEFAGGRWYALLTVADSGPGVADSDRPRIFERFYRSPAARSVPGSGLGLAIVEQVVALHDGTVGVARSDTGGAVFTVRLPALSPET
ncbi:MAG: HAMP domain-containing sensor histidine kinase [Actinocatenispora sp.]